MNGDQYASIEINKSTEGQTILLYLRGTIFTQVTTTLTGYGPEEILTQPDCLYRF